MSFSRYIYWCAVWGGWLALAGWLLGRTMPLNSHPILEAGFKGLCLGWCIALGLGAVDALWNLSLRRPGLVLLRGGTAGFVGLAGGWFGGLLGQSLFLWQPFSVFLVLGWTVTGMLVGFSIGAYELLVRYLHREGLHGVRRKIIRGVLGGAVGGCLGGTLSLGLRHQWGNWFHDKPLESLWSPSGTGFILLGLCIGLLVALAQVLRTEAWVRVEEGWRCGRELLLGKPAMSIGRAEESDIPFFGDAHIERTHARIVLHSGRYMLLDAGTPGGTYVNGRRITGPVLLNSGDLIRMSSGVLRFHERRKA